MAPGTIVAVGSHIGIVVGLGTHDSGWNTLRVYWAGYGFEELAPHVVKVIT